tara:strand:- start:1140 stop:1349 length:210 start_codon:yes stop_codon:yes gene_type:complete
MRSFNNFCRPLCRPQDLLTKPARNHTDEWILALRDQLRLSVGLAYRVGPRRGKTKLDIRLITEQGSTQI